MVKNLPADEEDARDTGSIPGSGKSPGGGQELERKVSWKITLY